VDALDPREVRVLLPRDPDGTAQVTKAAYEAISALATWSTLPSELTGRGRTASAERLAPRRVHAKVYRLWARDGRDVLIVGSSNLTNAGTSHSGAGNLEACFVVDVTDLGFSRRWWLEPIDQPVESFADTAPEEGDGLEAALLDVSIRFDWKSQSVAYRAGESVAPFEVCEASGQALFTVKQPRAGTWVECGEAASKQVAQLLISTSFLLLRHAGGEWRVLVREENMGYRPSLLLQLSPDEILEFWSLLSPEQRAAFMELRVDGMLDGLQVQSKHRLQSRNTLFDRFAGIYHAFGCLKRHVEDALEEGMVAEAEARFLGARYDSLPALLEKSLEQADPDPVVLYVTFLCAQQLRTRIDTQYPDFFLGREEPLGRLDALLERGRAVRTSIDLGDDGDDFLSWYEAAFLKAADQSTEIV
jgi:hypothetical protein